MNKTALIVGSTGLVGSELLDLLLHDPYYDRIIALVRRQLPFTSEKLVQCIIGFDDLSRNAELIKGNHVFCCLGTTMNKAGSKEKFYEVDYIFPVEIARYALKNGAVQFNVISAMGANPESMVYYNRVKGEMEETVQKIGFPCVNIFRPSLLLGNREEFRFGESLATLLLKSLSFIFKGKLKKYKPIEATDVAIAMLEIAKKDYKGIRIFPSDQIEEIAISSL